ncbi:MAG TPA: TIR domain-containing protein [Sphingomicrobium sp.]|nr:TIR domain-containing protein [Sphingomicrobium sp.]
MSDVFISYKAEDRSRVRPLVEALEAEGLSVWWDAHVGGGEEWRDSIARHLDEAACVIVIWSKRSVGPEGHFVRDEATRALRRHAYLPVRIDKVDPPLGFGETQALPLHGWKGNRSDPRYIAVKNGVRSIIGLEAHHEVSSATGLSRRPVMIGGAAAVAAVAAGGWWFLKPSAAKANSIAVLPFANLSGDPAQAYFSDGIAEELRSALSRIAGLQVVARTSSEMLRDADAKTAAHKLGVEHVVSGSVRRSPSMIRVNAQLIDGDDGLERWSETFDRPAGDVLEIQTSIAQSVAQALSIRLAGKDREVLTLGGTRDPAAQDLFFQARPERLGDTEASLRQGVALLDAAIALDPNFADAHATRAIRLSILAGTYALSSAESQRGQAQALASANRAIAIAPRLARGYAARALIYAQQLNMGAALAELVKADALPGSDAETLRNYANVLGLSGRPEEALRMSTKATRLDPLNPVSFETHAVALYHARRYTNAVTTARRSLQLSPDRQRVRSFLANALLALNKTAEAETEFRKLDPTDYRRLVGQAVLAARARDRASAMTNLRAMQQRYGDSAHYQYGEVYAQLGSSEQALAELELALEARDPGIARIRVDPFLDPIRRDPRFAAIEAKLNFPPA